MTEAQRRLATRHLGLAWSVARRHTRRYRGDFDAALSAAYWGLVQAAMAYQPNRGAFSTLAVLCCIRAITHDGGRGRWRTEQTGGFPDPIADLPDSLDRLIFEEDLEQIRAAIAGLPELERLIITASAHGETHRQIAHVLRMRDQTIVNARRSGLARLRQTFHV